MIPDLWVGIKKAIRVDGSFFRKTGINFLLFSRFPVKKF